MQDPRESGQSEAADAASTSYRALLQAALEAGIASLLSPAQPTGPCVLEQEHNAANEAGAGMSTEPGGPQLQLRDAEAVLHLAALVSRLPGKCCL